MIQIIDKTQCCGCTACEAVCPQSCISLNRDAEGFAYPIVDLDLCIGCDACEAVCPCLNRIQNPQEPQAMAVRAKDQALRLFSSSGGVFSLLASDMLEQGGAVCGAVFDENFMVRHSIVWEEAGVESMRGAKYVQSDLNDTFRQIRDLVDGDMPSPVFGHALPNTGIAKLFGKRCESGAYGSDCLPWRSLSDDLGEKFARAGCGDRCASAR